MRDNEITNTNSDKITTYVMYIFITNVLFLLMISPLIIYSIIFQNNLSTTILFLLSLLIGPSATALFSIMGKLIREGNISPVKDYFHFYKMSLIQSLIISVILNLVTSIVYFDMNYFNLGGEKIMACLFFAALILIQIISLYIYPLISRYNLKIIDVFKISIRLFIKKPYISLASASIIIVIFGLVKLNSLSLILILLMTSTIAYVLIKIQRETIDGLENYIKNLYQ